MTLEELTVRRVTVDLPGGRLLRVEPWEDPEADGELADVLERRLARDRDVKVRR